MNWCRNHRYSSVYVVQRSPRRAQRHDMSISIQHTVVVASVIQASGIYDTIWKARFLALPWGEIFPNLREWWENRDDRAVKLSGGLSGFSSSAIELKLRRYGLRSTCQYLIVEQRNVIAFDSARLPLVLI